MKLDMPVTVEGFETVWLNDEELQTLRSAIRLCDYSIVREKAPYEVLGKFTYEDYLRKYNEHELLERLGYGGGLSGRLS